MAQQFLLPANPLLMDNEAAHVGVIDPLVTLYLAVIQFARNPELGQRRVRVRPDQELYEPELASGN